MASPTAQWGALAVGGSGRLKDHLHDEHDVAAVLAAAVVAPNAGRLLNFDLSCRETCNSLHKLVADNEDPAVRRHAAKVVFAWLSSHLEGSKDELGTECQEVLLDSIVASLLDVWSQIRKDSAKLLFGILPLLPQNWAARLAGEMQSKLQTHESVNSTLPGVEPPAQINDCFQDWRVLEGAVLALAMLVKRFEALQSNTAEVSSQRGGVRGPPGWLTTDASDSSSSAMVLIPTWVVPDGFLESCVLPLLGHQQKTLRDTAVQLVAAAAARCPPHFTEHMLETMLQTLDACGDSLLPPAHAEGCLALLVLLVRRQALPLPVAAGDDSPPTQGLWPQLTAVVSAYVGHSASTVRQAASKLALQLVMAPCAVRQLEPGRQHRAVFVLHVLQVLSDTWKCKVLPQLIPLSSGSSALQSSAAFSSEAAWQLREGVLFCYEMITHYLLQDHARLLPGIDAQDSAGESEGDAAAFGAVPPRGEAPDGGAARVDSGSPEGSALGDSTDATSHCIPPETLLAFPFGLPSVPAFHAVGAAAGCNVPVPVQASTEGGMRTPVKARSTATTNGFTPRPALVTDSAPPHTPLMAPSPWASVTPLAVSQQATNSSRVPQTPSDVIGDAQVQPWVLKQLPRAAGLPWAFQDAAVPVPVCVLTALQPQKQFQRIVQDMLFHTQLCVECPKFELRRMGGQLLPALADVCLWVAPGALLRLAAELGIAIPLRASQAVLTVGRVFNRVLRRCQRLTAATAAACGRADARTAATYVAAVLSRAHSLLKSSGVQLALQGMAVRAPSDKCLVLALDSLGLALRQGASTTGGGHAVRPALAALLERCSKVLRLAGAFAHASSTQSLSPAASANEHRDAAGALHAALALSDELACATRPAAADMAAGTAASTSSSTIAPPAISSQRSVGFSEESQRWASRGQWRRASRQAVVVQSLQHAFSRRMLPHWFAAWEQGHHVAWLQQLQSSVEAAAASWTPASLCDHFGDGSAVSAEEFWRLLVQPPLLAPDSMPSGSGAETPPSTCVATGSAHAPGEKGEAPVTSKLLDCVAVLGRLPSPCEQLRSPEPAAATPAAAGGTPVSGAPSVLSGTTSETSSTAARPVGGAGEVQSPTRDAAVPPTTLSPGGIGHSGHVVEVPTSPGFFHGHGAAASRPTSAGDAPGANATGDSAAARQQQAQVLLLSCVRALLPDMLALLQATRDAQGSALNAAETALLCAVCASWAARLPGASGGAEAWEALQLGAQCMENVAQPLCQQGAVGALPAVWLQHWTQDSLLVSYLSALAAPHTPAAWAHCSGGDEATPISHATMQQLLIWDAAASVVAAAVACLAPDLCVGVAGWGGDSCAVPCRSWGTTGLSMRRRDAAVVPTVVQAASAAVRTMAMLPLGGAHEGAAAAWGAVAAALLHRASDGNQRDMSIDGSEAGPSPLSTAPVRSAASVGPLRAAQPPMAAGVGTATAAFGADSPPPSLHTRNGSRGSPSTTPGPVSSGGLDPVHWRGQTEEVPSFRQSRRHLAATLQPIEAGGSDMQPSRDTGSGLIAESAAVLAASGDGGGVAGSEAGSDADDWDDWDEASSTSSDEGQSFGEVIGAGDHFDGGALRFAQVSLGSLGSPAVGGSAHADSARAAAGLWVQLAQKSKLLVSIPEDLMSLAN